MFLSLSYQSYEIETVSGDIHTFAGCSAAGQFEFDRRLSELKSYLADLESDQSAALVYRRDRRFRWLVDSCLKLNGIEPHWVNWQMIEQLLFFREVEGVCHPGWLITISQTESQSDGARVSLPELVALVGVVTGDLTEAIAITESLPTQALLDILTAYADQLKTPEQKEAALFAEWKNRKLEQMQQRSENA